MKHFLREMVRLVFLAGFISMAEAAITAEPGSLKRDQPLDPNILEPHAPGAAATWADLPITDAGPGFVAKPLRVASSSIYFFPEGEAHLGKFNPFGPDGTGTVIHADLFAPQGRTIQSVSGVRVLEAIDDKRRAVAFVPETKEMAMLRLYGRPKLKEAGSARIQLRLQVPEPDAQTIEIIAAEAIAVTTGNWKELTFTNVQRSAQKEIDLSDLLPGAIMAITKVNLNDKNHELTLDVRIKGPTAIRQLELRAMMSGRGQLHSSESEHNYTANGNESTRTIMIHGYGFDPDHRTGTGSISLLVRSPQDRRRERVRFSLKPLDL